jgi:tetratricopeptide (TPR) repeat protein
VNYIRRFTIYNLGAALVMLLLVACSTKKNTFVNRTYHNITSKYNGYFHAREIVKEAQKKIEAEHKDDYRKILPVYSLGDDATAKSVIPDMEKAFKKCSEVIKYHSMLIKGKEYCDWIDNTYFVIGQTHYFKKEYYIAAEVFDYVAKEYKAKDTKHLALIWQLRSYNENGSFANAQLVLDILNNDRTLPKELKGELALAHADYLMKRESYELAADQLNKALALIKKKSQRARITFILAQLYQRTDQCKKASRLYSEVIDMNPKYEMVFHAKINRAKCTEGRNAKGIKEELVKMSKDAKNKEFLDQIYYTLGEIEYKENNEKKAIYYFKESVAASISDNFQKSLSYLKLADIYFKQPDYELSQAYYDSTVSILPKDFPDYNFIVEKKNSLTELIKNIKIVAYQDSMLRIAAMSEEERDRYAERMIAKAIEEEKKKQEEEEQKKQQMLLAQNNPNVQQQQNQGSGSNWYFYNQATVNFGITDFKKKWGDRKLEDNWRRSNKSVILENINEEEQEEETLATENGDTTKVKTGGKSKDIKSKEYYLQDVPLTADKQSKAHETIKEALYNCGTIYKEQLQDFMNAILAYEDILNRYDTSKYHLPLYYQLYRLSNQINDTKRAEKYRTILKTKYPNSPYAKLIDDPDYMNKNKVELSEIEKFYAATYELFTQKQYASVIARSIQSDTLYPKSKFAPQFHYMKAMSLGALKGPQVLEEELKKLIVLHPQNEVKKKAEEMLEILYSIQSEADTSTIDVATSFIHDKNAIHNCIILVKDKSKDLSEVKNAVSDFNNTFYESKGLKINSTFLGNDQLIIISSMEDKANAMKYYNNIISETGISTALSGVAYQILVISGDNFQKLFKDKNIEQYYDFFERRYLNKKK